MEHKFVEPLRLKNRNGRCWCNSERLGRRAEKDTESLILCKKFSSLIVNSGSRDEILWAIPEVMREEPVPRVYTEKEQSDAGQVMSSVGHGSHTLSRSTTYLYPSCTRLHCQFLLLLLEESFWIDSPWSNSRVQLVRGATRTQDRAGIKAKACLIKLRKMIW